MPVGYFIDSGRRVVFIRGWGVLSDGQLLQCTEVLLRDPRFDSMYGRLADFRDVTRFAVAGGNVRRVSEMLSKGSPARRATIVAGELAFGLARMAQLSADSPSDLSLVCRDLPEALVWLGLVPTAPWPEDPLDHVEDEVASA